MHIIKRVIAIIAVLLLGLLAYMNLETRWLKTNFVEIKTEDTPALFKNSRIVFVSDIHHGPYLSRRRVRKLVNRINSLSPDIILLGGDYVQRNPKYIAPFFEEAKRLEASIGIYGVLGNHDHWEGKELTRKSMTESGFNICDNTSFWIRNKNDSIKIGGVGDLWEDDQIINNTIYDLEERDFCILISHNPDYFAEMNTNLVDLAVAGHTHGGQVTFFGRKAPVLPIVNGEKYRYGLIQEGNNYLYITSGVGTVTPPVRFFCRPEIVVFTF
jgi:predicted MPP superfamily phosphohydrolase